MLNRSAVVVKAKQPFVDWLRSLPDPVRDSLSLGEINEDAHVYLVPEWDTVEEREELLREGYDVIFENELSGWWQPEEDWPQDRTFKMFKGWFEVEFHSMLVDLVEAPLQDDDPFV